MRDCVVIGSGHNGLIAACYLAAAGLDVEVVEADTIIGGAVSTVERWPGVRVDRGSSLHVMIRQTDIVEELDLESVGLRYLDADPFAVLPDPDRGPLIFHTDLDRTCEGMETVAGQQVADGYRSYVEAWTPRWRALLDLADATSPRETLGAALPMWREQWRHPSGSLGAFLGSADADIDRHIGDERLATAIAWWGAQAGPAPHEPATAPIAGSLALLHQRGAARPAGGSGLLTQALAERLRRSGGNLRLGDAVLAIETVGDRVQSVTTASGQRIRTRFVLAACHAATTMRLLGRDHIANRIPVGNGIGLVLRLLTDTPPRYDGDGAPADRGMTWLVRSREQIRRCAEQATAGRFPDDPVILAMTPTIGDGSLAPSGRHVTTLWAQWAPYDLVGGATWASVGERAADRVMAVAERWAPGLTASVRERWVQTPLDLERELGLLRGDVMHVPMVPRSLFWLRPRPRWHRRTPIDGLYLAGASTHPGGGVWGASGRAGARVLLSDLSRSRRSASRPTAARIGRPASGSPRRARGSGG